MFRKIKSEIRIIGWDDSPFTFKDKQTTLIGVVCRGGTQIDGVLSTRIRVDGWDSTEKLIKVIKENKHYHQLRLIMLDGITFGGFNIVDTHTLWRKTKLPVIVVIRNKPDLKSIKKSLKRFKDFEKRWKAIERAGEIHQYEVRNKVLRGRKTIYYQHVGLERKEVEDIINLTSIHSVTPEPVRLAHLICSGLKGI
jgi:hypothetical protein